jgi:hypothetical protein
MISYWLWLKRALEQEEGASKQVPSQLAEGCLILM